MNATYESTKKWREERPWYRPLEYAKRRCTDKNHKAYSSYGGRGIRCTLTYPEAKILYERDRGHKLKQPSLDRKEPDGHYTFRNCRYIELVDNVARRRPNGTAKHHINECRTEGEWEE